MAKQNPDTAYVEELYRRLDVYRKTRRHLAQGWLLWVLSLLLVLILAATLTESAPIFAIMLVGGVIAFAGVLVWRTMQTGRVGEMLEREVEAIKRQEITGAWDDDNNDAAAIKPERDDAVYTIGDDGELVEYDPFEDDDPHNASLRR